MANGGDEEIKQGWLVAGEKVALGAVNRSDKQVKARHRGWGDGRGASDVDVWPSGRLEVRRSEGLEVERLAITQSQGLERKRKRKKNFKRH